MDNVIKYKIKEESIFVKPGIWDYKDGKLIPLDDAAKEYAENNDNLIGTFKIWERKNDRI